MCKNSLFGTRTWACTTFLALVVKNASLGEMISNLANAGVQVPGGFATTAYAFNQFLEQSGLNERIYQVLDGLNVDDVNALAKAGAQIRQWVIDTPFQTEFEQAIQTSYQQLQQGCAEDVSFAVPQPQRKICLMLRLRVSRKLS